MQFYEPYDNTWRDAPKGPMHYLWDNVWPPMSPHAPLTLNAWVSAVEIDG